jgi:hypothetical protein
MKSPAPPFLSADASSSLTHDMSGNATVRSRTVATLEQEEDFCFNTLRMFEKSGEQDRCTADLSCS